MDLAIGTKYYIKSILDSVKLRNYIKDWRRSTNKLRKYFLNCQKQTHLDFGIKQIKTIVKLRNEEGSYNIISKKF
jgi:hypothetical protein